MIALSLFKQRLNKGKPGYLLIQVTLILGKNSNTELNNVINSYFQNLERNKRELEINENGSSKGFFSVNV